MNSLLGPPDNIQLASLIRLGLVIAWWLLPFALVLSAAFLARRQDRRGLASLAWLVASLLLGSFFLLGSATLLGGFARHGNASFLSGMASFGKCLLAPDAQCPWPSLQLVVAPVIYVILIRLVLLRQSATRGHITNGSQSLQPRSGNPQPTSGHDR